MTLKSNVTHLHANNVSMSELRRKSFPFAQKLESVDLSWNSIRELNETAFYDAPKLVTLNLSHNSIGKFASNVFEKLESLKSLDLSYNQISVIPFDLFEPLKNTLEHLNLRHNRLSLKFGIFPENIRALDLSENNLEIQLKFKIFTLLPKLDILMLHGNRIEGIHQSIYDSNIKMLGLSDNLFPCNVLADIVLALKAHKIALLVENFVTTTSNIHGIKCVE
jgi:Leucine-rich repeat (LRR) protein